MEPGVQSPDATLSLGSGSCRDSAWLLVQMLRRLGLAARFVSGYLIQLKADIDPIEGPLGTQTDFTDPARLGRGLHPRRRLDRARRNLGPVDRRGPHPARRFAALPDRRGDHRPGEPPGRPFRFLDERDPAGRADPHYPARSRSTTGPRSTRSANRSRADLQAQDVRLTMGGEPTFVSIDDSKPPSGTSTLGTDQAEDRRATSPTP